MFFSIMMLYFYKKFTVYVYFIFQVIFISPQIYQSTSNSNFKVSEFKYWQISMLGYEKEK